MSDPTERFLLLASSEKGHDFMRQCAVLGIGCTLLTLDALRNAPWPQDALEEISTMPAGLTEEQIVNTVSWMSRGRRFDRIVALDALDLQTAAMLREHMRIPGMGITTAACYRDRLAMRVIARALDFAVPGFCRVLNYDELRAFMSRVPPPWLLKPRTEASAEGIHRIHDSEQLWHALEELGDRQSRFLLEQVVPGGIYHVDSIVSESRVVFSAVHRCGQPALDAMHEGRVFTTHTVDRSSSDWRQLTAINDRLAPGFGMVRGVTHATFIRSHADGRFYFLEIAARVGGAFIADLVEHASGINLWREWANIEAAHLRAQAYTVPSAYGSYAGSVFCLDQTAEPAASVFTAPEIVHRIRKQHHAGLIVRSDNPARVEELLSGYSTEFAARLLAALPPTDSVTSA
jgi:biotin carboxylase